MGKKIAIAVLVLIALAAVGLFFMTRTGGNPAANLQAAGAEEARTVETVDVEASDVVYPLTGLNTSIRWAAYKRMRSSPTNSEPASHAGGWGHWSTRPEAHAATAEDIGGRIVVAEDGSLKDIDVSIQIATLFTDNESLTESVTTKEDWFGAPTYPTGTFRMTSHEQVEDGSYQITGNLALRDTEKSIVVPATVEVEGETLSIEMKGFQINREDFGIVYGDAGAANSIVFPEVEMRIKVVATLEK